MIFVGFGLFGLPSLFFQSPKGRKEVHIVCKIFEERESLFGIECMGFAGFGHFGLTVFIPQS